MNSELTQWPDFTALCWPYTETLVNVWSGGFKNNTSITTHTHTHTHTHSSVSISYVWNMTYVCYIMSSDLQLYILCTELLRM